MVTEPMFVVVELEYLERSSPNNDYTERATRHHCYHGPATAASCAEVVAFVVGDPDYNYATYFNVVSYEQYLRGVHE